MFCFKKSQFQNQSVHETIKNFYWCNDTGNNFFHQSKNELWNPFPLKIFTVSLKLNENILVKTPFNLNLKSLNKLSKVKERACASRRIILKKSTFLKILVNNFLFIFFFLKRKLFLSKYLKTFSLLNHCNMRFFRSNITIVIFLANTFFNY